MGRALVEYLGRRCSYRRFLLLSTGRGSSPDGERYHVFYRSPGLPSYGEKRIAGFALPGSRPDVWDMTP
ncbi:hypothetical protein ACIRS1_07270 [Kitasatospora sp. NPDC101176]|uniref:hypothetical protein n=1 Tax=Kitasatospora sp. NPDC101176 TaxID=3364099 RepID=UPI00381392C0